MNLASRLEVEGFDNAIQVSEATYWRLQNLYEFEERGPIDFKGDITVNAYILKGRKLLSPSSTKPEEEAPKPPILRSVD